MSRENVEAVRELLEGFARRDHERAFDLYDPEIEWDARGFSDPRWELDDVARLYRGHDGVRAYWRAWLQAWRDIEFEVADVLDGGDDIVALVSNQRMIGRHSGIAVDGAPYGLVFTFRGGKVIRWRFWPDQESAVASVGLSPAERGKSATDGAEALARRFMEALNRLDPDELIAMSDPEVEWHSFFAELREGGVYRGHEGVRQWMSDLGDAWDAVRAEVDSSAGAGDVAVLVGRIRYRGKGSGVESESPAGWMLKFRNGKVIRFRAFREPEQALEAVGVEQ